MKTEIKPSDTPVCDQHATIVELIPGGARMIPAPLGRGEHIPIHIGWDLERKLNAAIADSKAKEEGLGESEEMHSSVTAELWRVERELNDLRTACKMLLDSESVQNAWPITGGRRAEKPRDTFSRAEARVGFRHLLRIHQAINPAPASNAEGDGKEGGK